MGALSHRELKPRDLTKLSRKQNKLKSLKVAKSNDDDGGVLDGSVDAGDALVTILQIF